MTGRRVTVLRVAGDDLVVVSRPLRSDESRLSPAEVEVAKLVAAGLSNAEIAGVRRRSERTVANQVASILRKLGASSRHHIGRPVTPPAIQPGRPESS